MLNLDTHILLHAIAGRITSGERKLLQGDQWSISSIVLWEIAKLAQLGRIEMNVDDADLTRLLGAFTRGRSRWIFAAGFARWISAPMPPTKSSPPPASSIVCRWSPGTRGSNGRPLFRWHASPNCRYDVGGFSGQSSASRSFSILARSNPSPRFMPGHRCAADSQAARLSRFPVQKGHVRHCNGRTA